MTDFPDATNTGVTAGAAMTVYNGTYHVTQDNANISNLEVHGNIVIDADNVTMTNVKLVSDTPWHALRVMDDATGFTLQDSEIDGAGSTVNAIYGFGTFLRNDLHDMDNGINVVGASVIRDNYIHDFRGGADAHYDGVEINGSSNIDITHNTIINAHDQTSAVMMNNEFGGLSNITIEGNRLVGGGYTVYLDGRKGGGTVDDASIKIINNQIGDGQWGDFALYDDHPVVSGNTDLDTLPTVTTSTDTTPTVTTSTDTTPTDTTPADTTATDTGTGTGTDTGTDTGTSATVYTGTAGADRLPLNGKTNAGSETYKGLAGNDLLKGGAGGDALDGGAGTDTASYSGSSAAVKVSLGANTASGGHATGDTLTGIEKLLGSSYGDTLQGNSGNNVLKGAAGADKLDGGAGADTASYIGATAGVTASLAIAANNTGDAKGDTYVSIEQLSGSRFADKLYGNAGANLLSGGAGNDVLKGSGGGDALYGGHGADDLVGGSGADTFIFNAAAESKAAATGRDSIFDFSGTGGDRIDLAGIDASSAVSGDQAFTYLGTAAFTGKAGELRYVKQASDTYVYGDTNGDRNADFAIHLDDAVTMSKGYFVL